LRYSKIIKKVINSFEDAIREVGPDVNQVLENDYSYIVENSIIETLNRDLAKLKISQDKLLQLFLQDWSGISLIEETLNGADMISQSVVIGSLLDSKSIHKILSENSEILLDGWGWPSRFLTNSNCDEKALEILAEALIENGNGDYLKQVVSHPNASENIIRKYTI